MLDLCYHMRLEVNRCVKAQLLYLLLLHISITIQYSLFAACYEMPLGTLQCDQLRLQIGHTDCRL
jgi:hypothetical protein